MRRRFGVSAVLPALLAAVGLAAGVLAPLAAATPPIDADRILAVATGWDER